MQRSFTTNSLYTIFKLTDNEFHKIMNKMFAIENQCLADEIGYASHSLYSSSYNCFTSLNLLTADLNLKVDILQYFLDNQFNLQDLSHSFALALNKPSINIPNYINIFKLAINELTTKEESDIIPTIKAEGSYLFVNCDTVMNYKTTPGICSYDNICVLREYPVIDNYHELYPEQVNYNKEDNSFSYTKMVTIYFNDELTTIINQTLVFNVDSYHPIID